MISVNHRLTMTPFVDIVPQGQYGRHREDIFEEGERIQDRMETVFRRNPIGGILHAMLRIGRARGGRRGLLWELLEGIVIAGIVELGRGLVGGLGRTVLWRGLTDIRL